MKKLKTGQIIKHGDAQQVTSYRITNHDRETIASQMLQRNEGSHLLNKRTAQYAKLQLARGHGTKEFFHVSASWIGVAVGLGVPAQCGLVEGVFRGVPNLSYHPADPRGHELEDIKQALNTIAKHP